MSSSYFSTYTWAVHCPFISCKVLYYLVSLNNIFHNFSLRDCLQFSFLIFRPNFQSLFSKLWFSDDFSWNRSYLICCNLLNFILDRYFWGCSRMGGEQQLAPCNLSYIFCNDETWHSYTSSKEDLKNICITWNTLEFCWHQHFFTGVFVSSRNTDKDCILIHNF